MNENINKEALDALEKKLEELKTENEVLKIELDTYKEKVTELEAEIENRSTDTAAVPKLTVNIGKAKYKFPFPKLKIEQKIYTPEEIVKDKQLLKKLLDSGVCKKIQ